MKRLLLATDLCANSDRAMERALKLAKQHSAKLYILHAISDKHKEPRDVEDRVSEIESYVQDYLEGHQQTKGIDVVIDVIRSVKVHETICDHVTKVKADLIVMGLHRKARFMDMFLTTTSSRVLKNCSVPMLMVKEKPVAEYKSVLCGNDFAPGFCRAFDAAIDVAPDAHFDVLHACEKSLMPDSEAKKFPVPRNKEECEEKMAAFVDEQNKRYSRDLDVSSFYVEKDPYYALIEHAESHKSEVICVGTHGFETSKIGPVTNSLMADPPCDILVAKAPEDV